MVTSEPALHVSGQQGGAPGASSVFCFVTLIVAASISVGLGEGQAVCSSSESRVPHESPLAFACVAHCLDKEECVCVSPHQTLLSASLGFGTWAFFFLHFKWMPCWEPC